MCRGFESHLSSSFFLFWEGRVVQVNGPVLLFSLHSSKSTSFHEFYSEKKYPTMFSLLSAVKDREGDLSGERRTLWRVMHKMGFKYEVNDKRYIII